MFFSHAAAGWLALLGLAVPLAIYLWNRRPGRVVQVGSLRWLDAAANRRLRSIKPEQLLLFLLRAAVLSLLALALAEPTQRLPQPPVRGQVLLSSWATPAQVAAVRPLLDSLRGRGYQLRRLGFQKPVGPPQPWTTVGLTEPEGASAAPVAAAAPPLPSPEASDSVAPAGSLWSMVRQAADSLPNRPLVVLAPLTLDAFAGTRPALPAAVRWLPLPSPDSVAWPVAAWQPRPDSLVLLLAYGSENGISFRRAHRPWPEASGPVAGLGPGIEVAFDAPRRQFTAVTDSVRRPLPLLTRPLRLAVSYDAAHAPSARVLAAALRAAGSVLPLPPRLTVGGALPLPADSLDWLFWLRDAPVPAGWAGRVAQGLHIWQEAAGTGQVRTVSFTAPGSAVPVRVHRLDSAVAAGASTAWPLATGGPLLSTRPDGAGTWYRLHTRLDPAWSNLSESPELPALLLPLLLPELPAPTPGPDPRVMPLRQLTAGPVAAPTTAPRATPGPVRALAPWAVAAAGLLFGLERLLAARRFRQQAA